MDAVRKHAYATSGNDVAMVSMDSDNNDLRQPTPVSQIFDKNVG